jgi:hypothetical protein
MGAMLFARSATASTGWREASRERQPEPQILGLAPGQPAPASDHAWRGCPAKAVAGGSQGHYRDALSRGWIRGCSYRLELDFGPERECSGLEG